MEKEGEEERWRDKGGSLDVGETGSGEGRGERGGGKGGSLDVEEKGSGEVKGENEEMLEGLLDKEEKGRWRRTERKRGRMRVVECRRKREAEKKGEGRCEMCRWK